MEVATLDTEKEKVHQLWIDRHPEAISCDYNVALTLTDGSVHFCDLVVSATGVKPQFPRLIDADWAISDTDGGILVSENMNTNLDGIFAAGDCCSAGWEWAEHWFQMRLWHQARCMAFQVWISF